MLSIDLNGAWKMRRTGDDEWIEATVPGSVYGDLLAAGRMPDPFYRDNEERVRDLSRDDYEYERSFQVGREILECDRVLLRFDGLDTLAEVLLNGKPVGCADNMHRSYEMDAMPFLVPGANTIRVRFSSPIRFVEEKQKKAPLWGIVNAIQGFPYLRKAHCMFGWDWGPQLPDMGIWRSLSLRGYAGGRIDEVYVVQRHARGRVSLDLRLRCRSWGKDRLDALVVVSSPDGKETEAVVSCGAYESLARLEIEDPKLWWPNGYGEQPLYRIAVQLRSGRVLLDERKLRVGLRTMRVKREKDRWGESFEFEVNGTSIFAMGADYIPQDNILSRKGAAAYERLLKDCVAANFNCIRVWGGGFYPDDSFYDLCDELGLLVWQDLMFACAAYDLTDEFALNIKKEAEDNIRRIRHHPSLGLWCGNNEMEMGWVDWDYIEKDPKLKADYLRQFETILAGAARDCDPETFYWPSSPSSGGGFDAPNDENRGDVHYWEVWHGQKPFTEYRKFHFRFLSEFGFQSFPSLKTVESFTLPEDRNVFSRIMERHQKNGAANGKILYSLSENFKYPKDLGSLLFASQLLQAEAMKYGVEHLRRNRGRCMGAVYWQLNDCWPVASWSSIDYYGRWKALHYFAKRFYAPLLLSAQDSGRLVDFFVTNESRKPAEGEILWKLRDNSSRVLLSGNAPFRIDPLQSLSACRVDFSPAIPDEETARRVYAEYSLRQGGKLLSSGTLLFVKAKHFEFLDPSLAVSVEEESDRFLLRIESRAFAKYVEIDFKDFDCVLDDDYFDLSAGEPKVVEARKGRLSRPVALEEFRRSLALRSAFDIA
jgi:beta-mannosidase